MPKEFFSEDCNKKDKKHCRVWTICWNDISINVFAATSEEESVDVKI